MSRICLPYGRRHLELTSDKRVRWLDPGTPKPLSDLASAIDAALDHPVESPRLEALAAQGSVTILVPDKSRHARSPLVVAAILERLNRAGVPDDAVTVLVAAGDHPAHTTLELRETIGPELYSRLRVLEHRASDEAACVHVGVTRRGTPIRINQHALEADLLILTGVVSHHYFAGFGGGPKSLFPGAAALTSIRANHSLVLQDGEKDPNTCLGKLDGNPLHEDLSEAVHSVGPDFLVNLTLDGEGRPLAVHAGHWRAAHRQACRFLDEVASVSSPEAPYDLVAISAGGRPHDLNLVQAHKAIDRCAPLVRDGGALLVLAECEQGYGDPDLERYLAMGSLETVLADLRREFRVKAHTALCMYQKSARIRIHLASSLRPEPLVSANVIPVDDPDRRWRELLDQLPPGRPVALVPAGHFAVPLPARASEAGHS